MSNTRLKSHLRGTLYGLAVGDALGAPYEFRSRGSYAVSGLMEPSYTFTREDGSPMDAGTWTDDTSTALCLAESLNEKDGLGWQDVAKRLVKWYEEGYMSAVGYCFDIGNATRSALDIYSTALGNNQRLLALSGSSDQSSSGNGSLMRLGPIPVFYHTRPTEALAMSDLQSKVTHASQLCLESCKLATMQLLGFFELAKISANISPSTEEAEARKKQVLAADFLPTGVAFENLSFVTEEVRALRAGTWKNKRVKKIKTSGFVIYSYEAALWALWNSSSFEEVNKICGMLLLLPLGSDVDTVCAIYGQLAGALYGVEAIPERWLSALQRKDILENVFDKLVEKSLLLGYNLKHL